jgi:PAS domain S-box-containing protein
LVVDMNHKESPTPNLSPNTREDNDRKEEANRRVAEYSRAVKETPRASAEEGRERAERERIASEDLRQVADRDKRVIEEQQRDVEREGELTEENRALETEPAHLKREDAGREHDDKARQVAQASADSPRGVVPGPENVFQNRVEVQLQLLKPAIEESNESVIIMMAQLDPPGPQIVYVNPAFTKMTGYALEDVIGKTPHILQGPKTNRSVIRQLCKDCVTGKVFYGETINYRKDRSEIYLEWHVGPVRNERGEVTYFAAALRDVTERRRAEEELRRSEAQLRAILDQSLTVVFVIDLEGRYLRINRRCEVLFGAPEAEVKGKTNYDIHTKEIADALRANDQAVIAADTPLQFEERVVAVDGPHDFISVKFPLRDESGRPYAICGIATDITERKQAEAEREELLAREQSAREAAEDLARAKDEFLALVSHELRSPLNAILGNAALLRHGGLDVQMVKQAAEVIERSGRTQAQLIDDLLDTARIISGKLRLDLGPVDPVSVIEQAVQTIHPAADAKGISIETDLPSEIGQITGDPTRLQQVVWNLLSNAVKFTPQGGRVEVRLERIDPNICITVSDTGKGISPDFLPYVFDRFRQADASSAKRHGGLGLGLALVKYLVELHGGTIEATSAGEGQGATFKVMLPIRAVATPPEEAGGAPATVESSEELAGVRVLVVDDHEDARELLETALTQYGANVVTAGSAAEAYDLITTSPTRERPDVLVTDLGMPVEDGYSLIRRVREWERERDFYTPAIALSAYGRIEDRVRTLKAGFQMHLAKPVDPSDLAIVIENLIRS